jgi:hypothetical protein
MRTERGLCPGRGADRGRTAGEVEMRNPSGGDSGDRNPDPLAGGGHDMQREVQYVLVGSLIGAILLLIMFAIINSH